MAIEYNFKYMPLVGKLSGESMARQTETAINEIAQIVNDNTAQAEIINTLAQQANDNSVEALEKANEALETSGRVYINESLPVNLNSYCESQLIYIANIQSTNLPIAKTGFLEVKTDDLKTECVHLFISDDKDVYVRSGVITSETVGDVTTYSATFTEWTSMSSPTILLQATSGTSIPLSADLDDYTTEGTYYCTSTNASSLSNSPYTAGEFKLIVMKYATASYGFQALYPSSGAFYMRKISGGTWGDWETLATNKNVVTGSTSGTISVGGTDVAVNDWASKANLASPALTGTPTAPTQATGSNSTSIATTEYVKNNIIANLFQVSSQNVPSVESGDDLNDYITAGTYRSPNGATTNTLLNAPVTGAGFKLVVTTLRSSEDIMQILFVRSATIYIRAYQGSSGTWDNWRGLAQTQNVLALTGGTMTGALTVNRTGGNSIAFFTAKQSGLKKGTNPSSNYNYYVLRSTDQDDSPLSAIFASTLTNGKNQLTQYVYRYTEGTSVSRQVFFEIDTDGNASYYPTNNAVELGTTSNEWKHLYCGGATMSGQVTITGVNPASYPAGALRVKYTGITDGTSPSANRGGAVIRVSDTNGESLGSIYRTIYANGRSTIGMYNSWNGVTKGFSIMIYGSVYHVSPDDGDDNLISLGYSSQRWKQLYAGTTTISTSDERLKGNITAIPDEVLDAWGEVGWYQYQFNDSIAEKGESRARIHTGAIAQRIESVFTAHGLDANRYGLLCYDEWDYTPAERDEQGNITEPAKPAGNRYSLRYEEALCMEAAYQRRRADRLEERIARLEHLLEK